MLESSKEASTYSRIPEARSAPKVQKEMGGKKYFPGDIPVSKLDF